MWDSGSEKRNLLISGRTLMSTRSRVLWYLDYHSLYCWWRKGWTPLRAQFPHSSSSSSFFLILSSFLIKHLFSPSVLSFFLSSAAFFSPSPVCPFYRAFILFESSSHSHSLPPSLLLVPPHSLSSSIAFYLFFPTVLLFIPDFLTPNLPPSYLHLLLSSSWLPSFSCSLLPTSPPRIFHPSLPSFTS